MQRALLFLGASGLLANASPLQRRDGGCGTAHQGGYNNNLDHHTLDSGRTYTVFVPYDYDVNHNYPLIVDFHGAKGTADSQHENSQYDSNSRGQEYVVVYPNGNLDRGGKDQAWGGAPYTDTTPQEDLDFTNQLVEHIKEQYCIDSNRIYASGKSNGGGFVDTLACNDIGDQFAAFAMAAPALYTDDDSQNYLSTCPKKRAILEVHGDKDQTICYQGTDGGGDCSGKQIPHIDQWVSWWGQRTCGTEIQPDDPAIDSPENFSATSFSCEGREQIVRHFHGSEMGHCWPQGYGEENYDSVHKGDQCADRSMEFTDFVMDFFEEWDLGSAPQN